MIVLLLLNEIFHTLVYSLSELHQNFMQFYIHTCTHLHALLLWFIPDFNCRVSFLCNFFLNMLPCKLTFSVTSNHFKQFKSMYCDLIR